MDVKLSPIAAYTIRKILLRHSKQDESLIVSFDHSSANSIDLDRLLRDLYDKNQRLVMLRQLEALATCYQSLVTKSPQYLTEIEEIENQVYNIVFFNPPSCAISPSENTNNKSTVGTFERHWLAESRCQTVSDVLNVLNHLLKESSIYLGPKIAQRMLLSSQPKSEWWLSKFTINQNLSLEFEGSVTERINDQERALLRSWIASYIKAGSNIIGNFRSILEQNLSK